MLSFYYPISTSTISAIEAKQCGQNQQLYGHSQSCQTPHFNKNLPSVKQSPNFRVTETSTQIQLSLDVPGVKIEDIKVEVTNGGRVLHLSGGRKVKNGNSCYGEVKFDKCFSLGASIDASELTAHLADGVLTLTAPKCDPNAHTITISHGPAPELVIEERKGGDEQKSDIKKEPEEKEE